MTGTDATFTWVDASGQMHQVQGDGPQTFTLAKYLTSSTKVSIIASVITTNGDAGCIVQTPDRVILDNTASGQTAVTCQTRY